MIYDIYIYFYNPLYTIIMISWSFVVQAHLLIDGVMKSPAEFWRVAWPGALARKGEIREDLSFLCIL